MNNGAQERRTSEGMNLSANPVGTAEPVTEEFIVKARDGDVVSNSRKIISSSVPLQPYMFEDSRYEVLRCRECRRV